MSKVPGRLSVLILAFVLAVTVGCPDRRKDDGGQHTGGGGVFESTQEQVNSALDTALLLATETDPDKNIFFQMWMRIKDTTELPQFSAHIYLFPQRRASMVFSTSGEFLPSPFLSSLAWTRVERKPEGDCIPGIGRHTDGSVSSAGIQSGVCFSVGNLRRLPPSALLRQILALVLHEAAHLAGADEDEAVRWQKKFSEYFAVRFGEVSPASVNVAAAAEFAEIKRLLNGAIEIAKIDPKNPKIHGTVGQVAEKLKRLPGYKDEVALLIKLQPKRPDLFPYYETAISGALFTIQVHYQTPEGVPNLLPAAGAVLYLNDILKDVEAAEGHYKLLADGATVNTDP